MSLSIVARASVAIIANELEKAHARRVKRRLCHVKKKKRRAVRSRNQKREREYGLRWMRNLSDKEFRRCFRMPRHIFEKLLALVEIQFEELYDAKEEARGMRSRSRCPYVHGQQAGNSSGSAVSLRTSLACTIRWLAGGSYWDISALFGIGAGGFYSETGPLWPMVYALEAALAPYMKFDLTEEGCAKAAAGFSKFSSGYLDKCVCAVDGLVVRTRAPYVSELPSA